MASWTRVRVVENVSKLKRTTPFVAQQKSRRLVSHKRGVLEGYSSRQHKALRRRGSHREVMASRKHSYTNKGTCGGALRPATLAAVTASISTALAVVSRTVLDNTGSGKEWTLGLGATQDLAPETTALLGFVFQLNLRRQRSSTARLCQSRSAASWICWPRSLVAS